jgi:hypothetical protein
MEIGRSGGVLFIGGLVLFVVAGAIVIARGAVGIDRDLHLLFAASLGLVGAGAAILATKGPPALRGRLAHLGLAGLAIGSLVLAFAALVWGSLRGIELDFLLIPIFVGGNAVGLGTLAVAVSLVRTRGPWGWAGLALLAGMAVVLLGNWGDRVPLVMAAGGIVIFAGAIGVGLLATVSSESS